MAMPQCCYLAKGAKRPSHTTTTIKFDRIPFDPCNSIKRFDLCPFDQKKFDLFTATRSASGIYSTATGTCQSTKSVRYQKLSVVSHKQVHQCAASKVVCAMSSGRYLNLRGRGSSFDRSRLKRRMANLDTPALPTAEQGVVASSSYAVPS